MDGLRRFTLRMVVRGLVMVAALFGDGRPDTDESIGQLAPAATSS